MGGKGQLTGYFGYPSLPVATTSYKSLDQINVACYDDIYPGLVWHNDALYDPENRTGGQYCQYVMNQFSNSGIPKSKLGVGVPFYGWLMSNGVDASGKGPLYPYQFLKTPAKTFEQLSYQSIVTNTKLWQIQYMRRDLAAGSVPYLSIDHGGPSNVFVTYDDPVSVTAKWKFVLANGYGGVEVWSIGMDYNPAGSSVATRHPLAEALRIAAEP